LFHFEAKQSAKTLILFRFQVKQKNWKQNEAKQTNFWKQNKAKKRRIDFALVGSEKFEAKRSEKQFFFA
jgi:hypothetical protein